MIPAKSTVYREVMLKELKIEEELLDFHIQALSDMYLIYIHPPMPYMPWTHAHITTVGLQYHEKMGDVVNE